MRTGPPLTDTHRNWTIVSIGAWWIRVNAHTAALEIEWYAGPAPESRAYAVRWVRRAAPGALIPEHRLYAGNMPPSLWEDLRLARVMYLRAVARGGRASFCVFYRQHGVALVEFTGAIELALDVNAREPRCESAFDRAFDPPAIGPDVFQQPPP